MKYFLFLLLAGLTSCSEFFPGDGRFYVRHVQESATTSKYELYQTKGNGVTWIEAAPGRYHVGDTLFIQSTAK